MSTPAHIGNVPVEEWLPFLVPVIAVYLFARRRERRRREAVRRLLESGGPPAPEAVAHVVERWSEAGHRELSDADLPLLYPPGPDGATVEELATRLNADRGRIERRLESLAELGYVELDHEEPSGERRAWLTPEGCDLVNLTEDALLGAEEAQAAKR